MPAALSLTTKQLERALELSRRSHDDGVYLENVLIDGLPWVRINVLLTDMGDVPPLHTFNLGPAGRLRAADSAPKSEERR